MTLQFLQLRCLQCNSLLHFLTSVHIFVYSLALTLNREYLFIWVICLQFKCHFKYIFKFCKRNNQITYIWMTLSHLYLIVLFCFYPISFMSAGLQRNLQSRRWVWQSQIEGQRILKPIEILSLLLNSYILNKLLGWIIFSTYQLAQTVQ